MLTAGCIDAVISIYYHYSLFQFMKQLLVVLVIFYLLGSVVKVVLDVNFPPKTEEASEQEQDEQNDSEQETEDVSLDGDEDLENIDTGAKDE